MHSHIESNGASVTLESPLTSILKRFDDTKVCTAACPTTSHNKTNSRARKTASQSSIVAESKSAWKRNSMRLGGGEHRATATNVVVSVAPGPHIQPLRCATWRLA